MKLTEPRLRRMIREEARRLSEARDIMGQRQMNSYATGKRIMGYEAISRYKIVFYFEDGTTFKVDAKGFRVEEGRASIRDADDLGSFAEGSGFQAMKVEEGGGGIRDLYMKFGDGTVVVGEDISEASKPNMGITLEEHFNSLGQYTDVDYDFQVRAEDDSDQGRLVGTLNGTDITIRKLRRTRGHGWKGTVDIGGETLEVQSPTPNQFAKDVGAQAEEYAGGFFSNLF